MAKTHTNKEREGEERGGERERNFQDFARETKKQTVVDRRGERERKREKEGAREKEGDRVRGRVKEGEREVERERD